DARLSLPARPGAAGDRRHPAVPIRLARCRPDRRPHGAPAVRPSADALRPNRMAGDLYPAGIGHSLTPMVGTGWARETWVAVARAAWEALGRMERGRA